MTGAADQLLVIQPAGPEPGGPPLCCVHPISGSAYPYLPFGRMLPAGQPVCGLEAPGYDNAASPYSQVPALAASHLEVLLSSYGRDPLCLLGWSFGGVVAHEMAVQLARSGVSVPVLILVDSWQPQDEPVPEGRELLDWFLRDLLDAAQAHGPETERVLAALPESGDLDEALKLIAETDSPLADLGDQHLRKRYAVFSAHLRALYGHRPASGYQGRTVFVQSAASPPAQSFWRGIIPHFTERVIPGDHYSIWRPGEVAVLATTVAEILPEATAP